MSAIKQWLNAPTTRYSSQWWVSWAFLLGVTAYCVYAIVGFAQAFFAL